MPRNVPSWIVWMGLGAAPALSGCGGPHLADLAAEQAEPPIEVGAAFDASTAGAVQGRVTWEGELPAAPSFRAPVSPIAERAFGAKRDWPNPHAPTIDALNRGVAGAVVFLRGVDARRGRPWDHPPVRVELREHQFHVWQGDDDFRTGFVRRGDAVTFVSAQNWLDLVRARGAAFFALSFVDSGVVRTRRLERSGVIELSGAAGQFWMSAHLFVSDHPYYTRTAADGSFSLTKVPPGSYELVCWLPDWRTAARELDGDSWQISRLTFRPPLEKTQPIHLDPGETRPAWFTLSGR